MMPCRGVWELLFFIRGILDIDFGQRRIIYIALQYCNAGLADFAAGKHRIKSISQTGRIYCAGQDRTFEPDMYLSGKKLQKMRQTGIKMPACSFVWQGIPHMGFLFQ